MIEKILSGCVFLMRRVLQLLHGCTEGCGAIPLLAATLLLSSAALVPALLPGPPGPLANLQVDGDGQDLATIESVLAKRAPELGLTLRQQVSVAIAEEAARGGYDPLLILAIIDVESDFEEEAVSNKGARGLMQIKPSTLYFLAQKEGLRLSREEVAADPALCVRLGIRYLRDLHDRFGDLDLALMAYNAGPARIRRALKDPAGLEVFRRYPRLVRQDFRHFREGEGLGGDWALARRDTAAASEAPVTR